MRPTPQAIVSTWSPTAAPTRRHCGRTSLTTRVERPAQATPLHAASRRGYTLPEVASAAGAPSSTTRPWATRATRLAAVTVVSRCATSSTVLPRHSRSTASTTLGLGREVELRRRLVEDEHRRVLQEGPGEGHALGLSAGEALAAFAHRRLEPARQLAHQLPPGGRAPGRGRSRRQRPPAGRAGGSRAACRGRAAGAAAPTPRAARHSSGVNAASGTIVHEDPARVRLEEAQQQVGGGRLAGAGRPDERDRLSGRELEREVVESASAPGVVGEPHRLEPDARRPRRGPWRHGRREPTQTGPPARRAALRPRGSPPMRTAASRPAIPA